MARASAGGGRSHGARARGSVGRPGRRDAGGVRRANARSRVRRRRVRRPRLDRVLLEPRRPAFVPAGAGRCPPRDHAGASTAPRDPLRGPGRLARRPVDRMRSRASRGFGDADERARPAAERWLGRAGRVRRGKRFLRLPSVLGIRRSDRVAPLGDAAHALGRDRAPCGSLRGRRGGRGRRRRRRAGRLDLPAGVVPGRHPPLRLGPNRLVESPSARGRRNGDEPDPDGGRVRRPGLGVRLLLVRVPGGRPDRVRLPALGRTPPRDARPVDVGADRRRRALLVLLASVRRRVGEPDRVHRLESHDRARGRRARLHLAQRRRAPSRGRVGRRRGLRLDRRAGRVPDRRRRDGARLLLPAPEPRVPGPRGRAPAARRPRARRPDVGEPRPT